MSNQLITAGTGSEKTLRLLIPVLLRLNSKGLIENILEAPIMYSMTSSVHSPCAIHVSAALPSVLGQRLRITGEFAISFDFNQPKYTG